MAKLEAKVSIEKGIHKTLSDTFLQIFEKTGIVVKEVKVAWLDTSTIAKESRLVNSLELVTSSKNRGD